jgi:hypothetical protein
LARLQSAISRVHFTGPMMDSLEMARAMGVQAWRTCTGEPDQAMLILFGDAGSLGERRIIGAGAMLWRLGPAFHDLGAYLQLTQERIENARAAFAARSVAHYRKTAASLPAQPPAFYMIFTARMSFGLEKHVERTMAAETRRSVLVSALGIRRHLLKHGRVPEKLARLVPEFLESVPIDWMDGGPLRYERLSDSEFRLWSIGKDGIDQGGDPVPPHPVRRYRWDSGQDWVWPGSVTESELSDYATERIAAWRRAHPSVP